MTIELESMKYFANAEAPAAEEIPAPEEVAQPPRLPHRKPTARSGWSRGLTWIVIFFCLIGFFGTLSATFNMVALAINCSTEVKESKRMDEAEKMQLQVIKSQQKYAVVLGYMELMKLGLALSFVACAVMLVLKKTRGRSMGVALSVLAVLFHIANFGVGILVVKDQGIIEQVVSQTVAADRSMSQAEKTEMETRMKNFMFAAMLMGTSIGLMIKFVFYGLIMLHLRQPEIRRIFGDDELSLAQNQFAAPAQAMAT